MKQQLKVENKLKWLRDHKAYILAIYSKQRDTYPKDQYHPHYEIGDKK